MSNGTVKDVVSTQITVTDTEWTSVLKKEKVASRDMWDGDTVGQKFVCLVYPKPLLIPEMGVIAEQATPVS